MMEEFVDKEITGKKFNELMEGKILCKILNETWKHYDFQYKVGLNIDTNDFSPNSIYSGGGLHFTTHEEILFYAYYGNYYALITVPDDARVYVEEYTYKADKINIVSVKLLSEIDFGLDMYMNAVKENGNVLKHIKNQTPEMCLAAVKQYVGALQYVKEQTPEICIEAVRQNCFALPFVREQTPEICMAAVQKDGCALYYVKEQTPEICLAAVRENGSALKHVKEQTQEICLAAVRENGKALVHVKKETPEICLAAVKQNYAAIYLIRNYTFSKYVNEKILLNM